MEIKRVKETRQTEEREKNIIIFVTPFVTKKNILKFII